MGDRAQTILSRAPDAYTLYAGDKEPGLTDFDGNVVSLFSDEDAARYRQALAVPPQRRALDDEESRGACTVVQELLSSLALFHDVHNAELVQWAKAVEYAKMNFDEQESRGLSTRFFNAGDEDVSTFYIILSGQVHMCLPTSLKHKRAEHEQDNPSGDIGGISSPTKGGKNLERPMSTSQTKSPSLILKNSLDRKSCKDLRRALLLNEQVLAPEEQVIAELGPGDSFGEEAIFIHAEADRHRAEKLDVICAQDYKRRQCSAKGATRTLEILAVKDPVVLATLLQYNVGELRLRSTLAMESLEKNPPFRSEQQHHCVARVINTAGIFMVHRHPDDKTVQSLARSSELLQLEAGAVLYRAGQKIDGVYCLLSGCVDIMVPAVSEEGKEAMKHSSEKASAEAVRGNITDAKRAMHGRHSATWHPHSNHLLPTTQPAFSSFIEDTRPDEKDECAAHVKVSGMLVGKLIEAYAGHQEDREKRMADTFQSEIEEFQYQHNMDEARKLQDSLTFKMVEVEAADARKAALEADVHRKGVEVELGGDRFEMDNVCRQLEEAKLQVEALYAERAEIQSHLEMLNNLVQAQEAQSKMYADLKREIEGEKSNTHAMSPTQMASQQSRGSLLGFLPRSSLNRQRRTFTARVACKSRILKFPVESWVEACNTMSLFLNAHTFTRQLESMGLPIPSFELRAGVVVYEEADYHTTNDQPGSSNKELINLGASINRGDVHNTSMHPDLHVHVPMPKFYMAANVAALLPHFTMFAHITPHNLLRLAILSNLRHFHPLTVIGTQGLPLPQVNGTQVGYLILSGQVSTYKKSGGINGINVDFDEWSVVHRQIKDNPCALAPMLEKFFGIAGEYLGHGSIIDEHVMMGMQKNCSSTYVCCSNVWALEVSVNNVNDCITGTSVISRPYIAATILNKDPASRLDSENELLADCVAKTPFCELFPSQQLKELCGRITLRNLNAGELLFRQGDDADEMFLVLSGTFLKHCSKSKTKDNSEAAKAVSNGMTLNRLLRVMRVKNYWTRGNISDVAGDDVSFGPCTGVIEAGDSIGQSVCYMANAKRTTTVIARETSKVIVLKTRDLITFRPFLNIRAFFNARKISSVLLQPSLQSNDDHLAIGEFLRCLPLLHDLKTKELMTLAKRVKTKALEKGTIIYKCQDRVRCLFFLVEGAAAICTPDPCNDLKDIQRSNMQLLSSRGIRLNEEENARVSKLGTVSHSARGSDNLMYDVPGRGKHALARLPQDFKYVHAHSCILVKSSLVLAVRFKSISECSEEWKREEAEAAQEALSKYYPFSSWKQKELATLAQVAKIHKYQRGDQIFEQASVADQIFFVLSGEVSQLQKGMSHIATPTSSLGSRLEQSEKGGVTAASRPANITVAAVSAGCILGLDVMLQLNRELSNSLAIRIKEVEAQILEATQKLMQAQKNANMSRGELTAVRTKLKTLTLQKSDLEKQQHKTNTEGILKHKYRAVANTSNVKVLSVRRADIDVIGPRGSLLQIEKYYSHIVQHRNVKCSDIRAKFEEQLVQGIESAAPAEEGEGEQRNVSSERGRLLGEVRLCAALAGHRGGLVQKEDLSMAPPVALNSLMNLRKWLRKKYGKLGSAVTMLSSLYEGTVMSDRAIKDLCDQSACGLKPPQLYTALSRSRNVPRDEKYDRTVPRDVYLPVQEVEQEGEMMHSMVQVGRGEEKITDAMGRPVIFFSDLKNTLDNEWGIVEAAMCIAGAPGTVVGGVDSDVTTNRQKRDYVPVDFTWDTSRLDATRALLLSTTSSQKNGERSRMKVRDRGEIDRPMSAMTIREKEGQDPEAKTLRAHSALNPKCDIKAPKAVLKPGIDKDDPYTLEYVVGELSQVSELYSPESPLSPLPISHEENRLDEKDEKFFQAFNSKTFNYRPQSALPSKNDVFSDKFRTIQVQRPKTALERRSQRHGEESTDFFEVFQADFQGTVFSSRSNIINKLKRSLHIKNDMVKNVPVKPQKLEQLRAEYSATKGTRPASGKRPPSFSMSLMAPNRLEMKDLAQQVGRLAPRVEALFGKAGRSIDSSPSLETKRQGGTNVGLAVRSELRNPGQVRSGILCCLPCLCLCFFGFFALVIHIRPSF